MNKEINNKNIKKTYKFPELHEAFVVMSRLYKISSFRKNISIKTSFKFPLSNVISRFFALAKKRLIKIQEDQIEEEKVKLDIFSKKFGPNSFHITMFHFFKTFSYRSPPKLLRKYQNEKRQLILGAKQINLFIRSI